jgi:hypothetical protein
MLSLTAVLSNTLYDILTSWLNLPPALTDASAAGLNVELIPPNCINRPNAIEGAVEPVTV